MFSKATCKINIATRLHEIMIIRRSQVRRPDSYHLNIERLQSKTLSSIVIEVVHVRMETPCWRGAVLTMLPHIYIINDDRASCPM